ncbi:MAG: SAM-dependent methyltransferase [Clostridia bacterium]|nr:SAM-dependent methyltransferase [Clostridia bacterium]
MSNIITDLTENIDNIVKAVLSQPTKEAEYTKITVKPVMIKGSLRFQLERFRDNKVYHLNLQKEQFIPWFEENADLKYKQILITEKERSVHYHLKGINYGKKVSENKTKKEVPLSHNREKAYILKEGENIPALVELGVFTSDFRIVKAKYDKYKQINRFIELVDDEFSKFDKKDITILDFGCGKSYLTFILYYYFAVKRGMNTKIIGYDLKKDVVENCNKIAEKYGYDNLKFVVSDVTKDNLYNEKIDMIVTLHACDTATDYALNYAIGKGAKHIFSVPCCQHEVNKQIKKGGDMDILLKYGIIKERVSALLTDSIRATVLEAMGYTVDVIEFIDFEHSPKNIMLRAKKTKKINRKLLSTPQELCDKYSFKQTLLELVKESGEDV